MVCNTDVFNGYIRHAGEAQWRHLLRQDNLAEADYDPRPDNRSVLRAKAGNGANNGTYCTRLPPSDPRVIHTPRNPFLYRSTDAGPDVRRTAHPPKPSRPAPVPPPPSHRSITVPPPATGP